MASYRCRRIGCRQLEECQFTQTYNSLESASVMQQQHIYWPVEKEVIAIPNSRMYKLLKIATTCELNIWGE